MNHQLWFCQNYKLKKLMKAEMKTWILFIKYNGSGSQCVKFLVNRNKITVVFMFNVYNRFSDLELRAISILAQNVEGVFWMLTTTKMFPVTLVNFLKSLCSAFWYPTEVGKDSSRMK